MIGHFYLEVIFMFFEFVFEVDIGLRSTHLQIILSLHYLAQNSLLWNIEFKFSVNAEVVCTVFLIIVNG